jgi:alkylhydroperoxidase family enzyme
MSSPELQPEKGWITSRPARLAAPPPPQRGPLFRAMSRASDLFGRNEVPDVLTVLHINARLFWAWLFFASRLMPYGRLPAALREKIILRTAWNCRSRYEWGQHVDIALRCGVSDAEILNIAAGPAAFADDSDRTVMQACDELFREKCISDATWQVLARQHDEKALIEIMILEGHYEMLAGFLNTAGIALEAPTEAILQAFYRRTAAPQS